MEIRSINKNKKIIITKKISDNFEEFIQLINQTDLFLLFLSNYEATPYCFSYNCLNWHLNQIDISKIQLKTPTLNIKIEGVYTKYMTTTCTRTYNTLYSAWGDENLFYTYRRFGCPRRFWNTETFLKVGSEETAFVKASDPLGDCFNNFYHTIIILLLVSFSKTKLEIQSKVEKWNLFKPGTYLQQISFRLLKGF